MVKILHKWYRSCVNLIYPLECVVCHLPISMEELKSEFLCPTCFTKIKFITNPICGKCGRPVFQSVDTPSKRKFCPECNNKKYHFCFDRAFSVAIYEGVWKELIHIFKYSKNDYLDKFLSEFLIELIHKESSLKEFDLLIPVPMYWRDKLRREHNHTHLLSSQISKITGIPLLTNVLIKCKRIPSQTSLPGKERLKNVKGAFSVKNTLILKDKKVLLVDDVFTTGSTVNECAKMLRKAKARQVSVITLDCSY